ncbi:hypothetical protein [Nocardia miyunensis]|uniref:hypothetical protein n=1 Tax=Nocardia miyunensis TaxID=282684 RepID=UPI00082A34E6|nr:hypothetical protein [Nocardia miyunensis]
MGTVHRPLPDLPDTTDPNAIVVAFASNPAFRAAEWSELTTPGNPYRRPVRPDDLAWVKYHNTMPPEKALRLSALLGHRMLRNIYDLESTLVAPADGIDTVSQDRADFYSRDNRVRSALARPVLERHLFDFLDDAEGERATTAADALELVRNAAQRLSENTPEAAKLTEKLSGTRESAVFVTMQYHGFMPAVREALGRRGIGEYPRRLDGLQAALLGTYQQWISLRSAYRDLLDAADLAQTPGGQWQLLLGTSLARGNHLLSLAADPGRLPELVGAAAFSHLAGQRDTAALRPILERGLRAETNFAGFDLGIGWSVDLDEFLPEVLDALVVSYGEDAPRAFRRGFIAAERLHELWHQDLAAQLSWADQIELHQEYAEKIHRYLEDNNIVVDLDTFVESEEETSTTHVHNEHRLVMIEEGQMHFWNNATHKIELFTGDKILIPVSRLHGSTVLSGVCTYHQPIIPDDLLRKII